MRLSRFAFLASAAALAQGQSDSNPKKESTTFNGVSVPPLLELTPINIAEELKQSKYMVIKHYSPSCPHCIKFAPTYQTMYEWYYTSHPEGAPDASFFDTYDLRFGLINCLAYYDLCVENGVESFPTITLFEDGTILQALKGTKDMEELTALIEPVLEKQKPESRPKTLVLPEPGDTEFFAKKESKKEPAGSEDSKLALEKDSAEDTTIGKQSITHNEKSTEKSGKASEKTEKASGNSDSLNDKAEVSFSDSKKADDQTEKSLKKSSDKDAKGANARHWPQEFKAPTAADIFNERKAKKPSTSPNPSGAATELTAENFQKVVTMTQDPWFIKFYAPWCHHCQAMGPTWDQLAKNMQGKLNIGSVNCEKETRLCKDVRVKSYPTILFFKGGERAEYRGLRGLGDFVSYAESALDLSGGVPDVDAEAFEVLEQKHEVIFTYFYDHATTTEDLLALERLPLSLVGHAKLVKTNDPKLYDRFKITTWPRLLVSREGRPTYYTPLTPNEMRDVRGVLDWMRSVWLPLVPELTASNAKQIMDGKIVVLGFLNREDQDSFQSGLKEMKSAANEWMDRQIQEFQLERKKLRDAKQMRIEEAKDRDDQRAERAAKAIRIDMNNSGRKEVGFAWVDGVFWQRWIRTTYGIDATDGERVIINDQDARKYWDNTVTGNYIMVSRTAISESLDKIVYGPHVIKPKLTINFLENIWLNTKNTFIEHPYLSGGCVAGILFGVFSWYRSGKAIRQRARSASVNGYFKLEETMANMKDGLLGQNNNEKAD